MAYKITQLAPFGVLIEANNHNTPITDVEISSLRKLFYQQQLIILRGFKTFKSSEDFAHYCERWGEISIWPFGKVLELIEQDKPQDHIFDNSYIPMHWDGMYRPQVPEYQIFHCVKAPLAGQGGRTTFTNTLLALQQASPKLKELWNKVTGIYKRKMEFYNSKMVSPIITQHPHNNKPVIRYNEPPVVNDSQFVNPPDLEFTGVSPDELLHVHSSLKEILYSPKNFYAHEWQSKDVVIADNFSLLHGREEFVSKSPRHIQRVHVLSDPPFDNTGLAFHK